MSKKLNEELTRIKTLFNFKMGDNAHDVLSEQVIKKSVISEATQGCEQMIFKGNEINVENFGSILNCFDSGGRKFWATGQDDSKQNILNTLKQKYGRDLLNNGISTGQYHSKEGGVTYKVSSASWSGVKRGDKKGTGGYYLTKKNEIHLTNGSDLGLKNGLNSYNDVINKLNAYNIEAFIKNTPPKRIGEKKIIPELVTPKGVHLVYKRSGYKLIDDKGKIGYFLYYPLAGTDIKELEPAEISEPELIPMGGRDFGNETEPFEPDQTLLNLKLYNDIVVDLSKKLENDLIEIHDISIESSASNKRTSYGTGDDYTYEKNKKLAQDRGQHLYDRLKKEFGDQIPSEENIHITSKVQECKKTNDKGRCVGSDGKEDADPSKRSVKISYNATKKIEKGKPGKQTNVGWYVGSQWQLRKFKGGKYQKN